MIAHACPVSKVRERLTNQINPHPKQTNNFFLQENYKKDYVRYYVKNVYTDGPREDGVRFPVPVRGRPDFKDVDHYRYFHVKKETFLWEEDERYDN